MLEIGKYEYAKKDLIENNPIEEKYSKISYRPFDIRWTYYTGNSKGFHCYPRNEVIQILYKEKYWLNYFQTSN